MNGSTLAEVHAFWIGSKLGPISVACLKSFVDHGHKVLLHVYDEPSDVPAQVECVDENRTIPEAQIFFHKTTGSPAVFADRFRYELLRNGADLYVDCDAYCLKPIYKASYIFGMECDRYAAIGVLALPSQSNVLRSLIAATKKSGFVPPWLPARKKALLSLRKAIGIPRPIEHMKWGVSGPQALTFFAQEKICITRLLAMSFTPWTIGELAYFTRGV